MDFVAGDAWVWHRVQLRADLHYILKGGGFRYKCNDECLWVSRWAFDNNLRASRLNVFYSFIANAFPEVTPYLDRIKVQRGCGVDLQMVLTYLSRELRDTKYGWWIVACTRVVAKAAALLLVEVYDSYREWCFPGEMIRDIRYLELVQVLESRANPEKLELIMCFIERTNVASYSDVWSRRDDGRSLAAGRRGRGVDCFFYNLHNECAFSDKKDWHFVRSPYARLPVVHPIGWDFEALVLFGRELNGEFGVGSGMRDQLIRCDDVVPVGDDKFMAYEHAS